LIFSEVTPKTFAIRNAQKLSRWVARPLFWFVAVSGPVRDILQKIADLVLLKLGVRIHASDSLMSQKELKGVIRLGAKQGALDKGEQQMIKAVFELGEIPVRETMTPRVDMVCSDIAEGIKGVLEKVQQTHHVRIPVYEKTADNILGVVSVKELLVKPEVDLKPLLHPVLFVPEAMPIDQLFAEFRKQKVTFAIVVDEYGGTSGLATLEDVLEEIVGEIYDEYDQISQRIEVIDADQLLVHGMTSLRELEEMLEIEIPVKEAGTVGGLVLYLLGRFPKTGEKVKYGRMEFIVEEVGKKRIHRVRVIRSDSNAGETSG
jgi:putative hemolysin